MKKENKVVLRVTAMVTALANIFGFAGCMPKQDITITNTPNPTQKDQETNTATTTNGSEIDVTKAPEMTTTIFEDSLDAIPGETGIYYDESKKSLTYPMKWTNSETGVEYNFGNVMYENIDQAGIDDNGNLILVNSFDEEKIYIDLDNAINYIKAYNRHTINNGSMISSVPKADNLDAEYAWKMLNGYDLVAMMIVLDEVNISTNSDCEYNFSEETKELAKALMKDIDPEQLEFLKRDVQLFANRIDGKIYDFVYFNSTRESARFHGSSNLATSTESVLTRFVGKYVIDEAEGYFKNNVANAVELDYIFKNTNEEDPLKYVNMNIEMKKLYEGIASDNTKEHYDEFVEFISNPENPAIIMVSLGLMAAGFTVVEKSFEYNGIEYYPLNFTNKVVSNSKDISNQYLEDETVDGFLTKVGDTSYIDILNLDIIPEKTDTKNPDEIQFSMATEHDPLVLSKH